MTLFLRMVAFLYVSVFCVMTWGCGAKSTYYDNCVVDAQYPAETRYARCSCEVYGVSGDHEDDILFSARVHGGTCTAWNGSGAEPSSGYVWSNPSNLSYGCVGDECGPCIEDGTIYALLPTYNGGKCLTILADSACLNDHNGEPDRYARCSCEEDGANWDNSLGGVCTQIDVEKYTWSNPRNLPYGCQDGTLCRPCGSNEDFVPDVEGGQCSAISSSTNDT